MNLKIPPKYLPFCKNLAKFLICETVALLTSFLLITVITITGLISGLYFFGGYVDYLEGYPGGGYRIWALFVAIGCVFVALWISLEIAVLIHINIFKKSDIDMPSKYSSFLNKLARFLIWEIRALSISLFLIVAIDSIAVRIAAVNYPSIMREGVSRITILNRAKRWSLLFSLPPSVLIHIYCFQKFLHTLFKKESKR
jgi:hypothetical protein